MLSAVSDTIFFNGTLFARVAAIHKQGDQLGLDPEQRRLVEHTHDSFVRRGAQLDAAQKERLGAINKKLAGLFTEFGNRVQADEDTWILLGTNDLGGLPESLVASYRAAAEKRDLQGYAIVNTRSAVDPFLTFSEDRALREKVWRAFIMRGDNANDNNTREGIAQIVKLRAERARLLGYASHAHWRM